MREHYGLNGSAVAEPEPEASGKKLKSSKDAKEAKDAKETAGGETAKES